MLRRVGLVISLALLVGGILAGFGSPRLTLVNTGLRIEYPPVQGLALLGASIGLGFLAWALPRAWMRWIASVAALLAAAASIGRAVYRLDTADAGIGDRRLLGSTHIAWADVRRVDGGPALVLVWGPGDSQIRIETAGLVAEHRAVLERTLSRHVREAQEKARSQRPRS